MSPAHITCTCGACMKCYQREWARNRYRQKAYGTWDPKGDMEAVRRHIEHLRAHGLGLTAIGNASGSNRSAIQKITNGERAWISRRVAAKILAVTVNDSCRIPPYRVTRRLRALNRIGYSTRDLADRLGWPQETVWDHMDGSRKWVMRPTLDAVLGLYAELHMTSGGNAASVRSAIRHGYPAPAAWDDIDDIDENPHTGPDCNDDMDPVVVQRFFEGDRSIKTTRPEREAILAEWVHRGRSMSSLEDATGWNVARYVTRQEGAA